jgi:hypothetical protein
MGEQEGQASGRGFFDEPVVWYVAAAITGLVAAAYWVTAVRAGGFYFEVFYKPLFASDKRHFTNDFLAVAWTVVTAGLYLRGYFLAKPR